MPSNADPPDLLVDTSVAVALVVADHEAHSGVRTALAGRRLGLAGHAAFETLSVLTRLPSPARLSPSAAVRAIGVNFPGSRFLSPARATRLPTDLAEAGVTGGSVYDGLVGAAAKEHGMTLATRDRRALSIYLALGVDVKVLI